VGWVTSGRSDEAIGEKATDFHDETSKSGSASTVTDWVRFVSRG